MGMGNLHFLLIRNKSVDIYKHIVDIDTYIMSLRTIVHILSRV